MAVLGNGGVTMMKKTITALFIFLVSLPVCAQETFSTYMSNLSAATLPLAGTEPMIVLQSGLARKTPVSNAVNTSVLAPIDVRLFNSSLSCTGGVDASVAVGSAIAAGHSRIFLPAGCFYQPPTSSGTENVPAGVVIYGDPTNLNANMNTNNVSIVRTADRTNSGDALQLAQNAGLVNIAVQSNFCDQQTNPQGTQKLCPILEPGNHNSDGAFAGGSSWAFENFEFTCGSITSPFTQTDQPCGAIQQNGAGDGLFMATGPSSNGVNLRIWTPGSGDKGILVQNGINNISTQHFGFLCQEHSISFSRTGCFTGERTNNSTQPLIFLLDDGPATWTTTMFNTVAAYWSGGNLFNIFQGTTPSNGNFININGGNNSGTFTGDFLDFQIANSQVFAVDYTGKVFAQSYAAGAFSGVSCAAGTVSTATMVITAGIVTHC
jgi:hypothetical protein